MGMAVILHHSMTVKMDVAISIVLMLVVSAVYLACARWLRLERA